MFNITQNQHLPVFRRQRRQPLLNGFAKARILECFRRYFSPIRKVSGNVVTLIFSLPGLVERVIQVTPILSKLHSRFVDRNLNNPGTEFRLCTKACDCLEGFRMASCTTSSASASLLTIESAAR